MSARAGARPATRLAGAAGLGLLLAVAWPAPLEPAPLERAGCASEGRTGPRLEERVRLVVLHTLGGPDYERPRRRWTFLPPPETFGLWRNPRFGAHWIVWTDGSIWPRHPAPGEGASFAPPASGELTPALAERLVRHAAPVLSHVAGANTRSLGVELAHSGRSDEAFPRRQIQALAWLLRSLLALSGGRLGPGSVVGHKDLDRQPAWVPERCPDRECPVYVDAEGRPYRRRVDPPEALFTALGREGLEVPRSGPKGDAELWRAEAITEGRVPAVAPAAPRR